MRLRTRYSLTIVGLVGLVLVTVSATELLQSREIMERARVSSTQVMSDGMMRHLRDHGLRLAELLGAMLANPLYRHELDVIRDIARPTLESDEVTSIQVFDDAGAVLHDGTDTFDTFGQVLEDASTHRTLDNGETVVWTDADTLYVSAPIRAAPNGRTLGGVRLGLTLVGIKADIATLGDALAVIHRTGVTNQLAAGLVIAAISGAIALIVGLAVARNMSRPISALASLSGRIGRGEYLDEAPPTRRDEIGELGRAMHQMAADLRATTISKRQMKSILDSMREPLFVVDRNRRILTGNKAASLLLGYVPEALVGMPLARVVSCRLDRALTGTALSQGAVAEDDDGELIAVDGRRVPSLISAAPLLYGAPEGGRYVVVGHDITERKRGETELRRAKDEAVLASRSKSEFLANMSHELRTPLNAIIGFSEIIHSEVFGAVEPPQYRTYAEDIHESGHYLLSIINDILDMSKIEAGKLKLEPEWWSLADLVDGSLRLVAPKAEDRDIELGAIVDEWLEVYADARTVKQILVNLLSNAVKFTPDRGRISVRARVAPDGGVRIAVRDTGIGIERKNITTVLSPFGQVAESDTRVHEGTGLGLALVVSLTELHDGGFRLYSRVGRGTTAILTLPADRLRIRAPQLTQIVGAGAA